MKLRKLSLFGALAAALLFSAAFVPQANASVIVYYNFNDSTVGTSPPDFTADAPGTQFPVLMVAPTVTDGYNPNDMRSSQLGGGTGIPLNVAPGDLQTNTLAVALSHAKTNDMKCIEFDNVSTIGLAQLSLSFAYNNNGNGFSTATFQYRVDPSTTFLTFGTSTLTVGGNFVASASVPTLANNKASVDFRICFSGGTSNGNDVETLIDNVRLDAVPEPSTVMGGLLGACGLCWHQRRRLIRSLRLRRP